MLSLPTSFRAKCIPQVPINLKHVKERCYKIPCHCHLPAFPTNKHTPRSQQKAPTQEINAMVSGIFFFFFFLMLWYEVVYQLYIPLLKSFEL